MIITRAPLRISFIGGGSDLPSYYEKDEGMVISMAINKYVYIAINPKFDNKMRVSYSKTEHVDDISELEHDLVRACLEYTGFRGGLEIVTIADIPSSGTGLGSSSTFTVALLHGLHAVKGEYVGEAQLAEEACRMEIDMCKSPIGKQDQYAAAFGGLNRICFRPDGNVDVDPLIYTPHLIENLQNNLLLFYTGRTRSASNILKDQSVRTQNDPNARRTMNQMVRLAGSLWKELRAGVLDGFGPMLHESWMLKRQMSDKISDPAIDSWYERGRSAGAEGGKILGAGGGGFLLLYAQKERHQDIISELSDLRLIPFSIERHGSSVIFYHP